MSDDAQDREDRPPDEVVLPLEDWIDLHPFRPRDIRSVVESYLEEAVNAGFEEVRLVHGRGIGVQRETIRSLLRSHPSVTGFADAPPERGGWGATIVRLSRPEGTTPIDEPAGLDQNVPTMAGPIQVVCPCCSTRLTVDRDNGDVLAESRPERDANKTFEDAMSKVRGGAEKREEAFSEAADRTRRLDSLLDKKFEEARKKAAKDPTKPRNPLDLD